MRIQNERLQALLDEIYGVFLQIPHFAHFIKGDYSIASRFPDKSLAALIANAEIRSAFLDKIGSLRSAEQLSSYDCLALDLAQYFVDYVMFPVSPLLQPYYYLVFNITPYELMLEAFWESLPLFDCSTPDNVDKHMALAADYVRFAREMRDKVFEQADRGIYLFADVIPSTCEGLRYFGSVEYDKHPLSMRRPGSAATEEQLAAEAASIHQAGTHFLEIAALLESDSYQAKAPKNPGWGQYPGGSEYYRFLRRFYLGYDLEASQLHNLGLELLGQVEAEQAVIRRRLTGCECSHREFIDSLRGDERFFPSTPEQLAKLMNGIKDRGEEVIRKVFDERIETPCAVQRLDPALEKSVTFGYFQPSYDKTKAGIYFYNASGLEAKCQITSPALLAHELVPGHHFQQSYISEHAEMHPLIKTIMAPAYLEGWAEYAASLMTEAGSFDEYDEYGRLEQQKFICARLVVDTGLNELGWSMEQARQYMQENTFASAQVAASETLRYACSIPGQCLPYKYGILKLLELREQYKAACGNDYNICRFHSLVLNAGCIPLPLLQAYLERETA